MMEMHKYASLCIFMQNRGSENPEFGAGILFGRKYAYFRQTTNGVDYQMCKPESDTLDTCSYSFQGDLTNGAKFLIIYKYTEQRKSFFSLCTRILSKAVIRNKN